MGGLRGIPEVDSSVTLCGAAVSYAGFGGVPPPFSPGTGYMLGAGGGPPKQPSTV